MSTLPDSLQPQRYERTRPAALGRARALLDDAQRDDTLAFVAITVARDHIVQMTGGATDEEMLRAAGMLLCRALDNLHAAGSLAQAAAVAVAIEALGAKAGRL